MNSIYNTPMCYNCGTVIEEKIFRSTLCPSCGKPARVCLNCKFYSPGAQWDCREHISEPVREKDEANFCGYFKYSEKPGSVKKETSDNKKAFNDLFGDQE